MKKPRAIPKTRAVTATGSCGHTYNKRTPVPTVFQGIALRGEPLDEQTFRRLDKWAQIVAADRANLLCPDCEAENTLTSTREAFNTVADWLREERLSPLTGSLRQVAYGESVRANVFIEALDQTVWAAREATVTHDGSGVAIPIALASLQAAHREDPWLPDHSTDSVVDEAALGAAWTVAEECSRAVTASTPTGTTWGVLSAAERDTHEDNQIAAYADVLVSWLCLKFAWQWWRQTFHYPEATFWIARAPYPRRLQLEQTRVPLTAATVIAAIVTSRLRWDTLEDAWTFFLQLSSPRVAAIWTANTSGTSLVDSVTLAAVEATLTPQETLLATPI